MTLTHVDHLAIESKNISDSVKWYTNNFKCKIKHQDETWALLKFDNIQIALVTPGQHPPHFAIIDEEVANFDGANLIGASWTMGEFCGPESIGICNK